MEPTQPSLIVDLAQRNTVPNEFPSVSVDYKIAVIGEAPGADEDAHGRPFIGVSGRLLESLMNQAKILRAGSFMGNVCQIQPTGNQLERFDWDGHEIQSGMTKLREELNDYKPHICVLVGGAALHAAMAPNVIPKRGKQGFNWPNKISEWRGTLFRCEDISSPFFNFKCISSFHPAFILRTWKKMPYLLLDLKRARSEANSSALILPERHIEINLSASEVIQRLHAIQPGHTISPDIEGVLGHWTLIGIATSPYNAFVIDWNSFTEDEEIEVITELSRLMWDDTIYKILQNGLYDNFVTAYGYRIYIRGIRHDTMVKGWEIYPELEKALGVQASIWTREPHYKVSHSKEARAFRATDPLEWVRYREYCGTDCCVTYEISTGQDQVLSGDALRHYRFNMDMLDPILYMELRGINYDIDGAAQSLGEVKTELAERHAALLVRTNGLDLTGEKGSLSSTKLPKFLYGQMGFPTQFKKEHGRKTDKVTTDVVALLNLVRTHDHPLIHDILRIRKLESWKETLEIGTDPDGRVRASYSNVGTETGRFNCKTSPTGSGANLTTITEKYRCLYLADGPDQYAPEGYDFFHLDLGGADGWTVAARCASLGDTTMLEDYLAGIKPANIIALITRFGPEVARWERDHILEESKTINKKGWLYFACKRVQHATNYRIKKNTGSAQVLKDSYNKQGEAIYIPPNEYEKLQSYYMLRYSVGIERWHDWAKGEILKPGFPQLKSASGHTRTFFGRKKSMGKLDEETLREFIADEPQEITTYCTNRAMLNLWEDMENRRDNGSLIIQPLHQVHDALCGQWPKQLIEQSKQKVLSYFNNPVTVADITFTIPFDGGWGKSWGECENPI